MGCEPHAYARIASVAFRPETLDRALVRIRDVSMPLVRDQRGSLGILAAADRKTGKSYTISFWETRDDLERSHTNPSVVDALAGYAEWMTGGFGVASYDIVGGRLPDPGSDASAGEWARMTTIVAREDHIEGVNAAMQARLTHLEADASACTGALLMMSRVGQHLIDFELWSSPSALAASDADAISQYQRLWRSGSLEGPPRREVLEIVAYY